jgi:hypothetical protein
MEYYTIKAGKYDEREFYADQYGNVYESVRNRSFYLCKLNNRSLENAVNETISQIILSKFN